ncbi:MAG: hypothetical protein ACREEQ_08760 [Caulobacteraceae bacterium]
MTVAPDPSGLAPSRDPAVYGKRPLLTASFFAWVSLCVICVVAGVAIGRYGRAGPRVVPSVAPNPSAQLRPPAPAQASSGVAVPEPPATATTGGADQALEPRVARLEASSSRLDRAAIRALAASAFSDAATGSAPFEQDLAAYQRLAPDDPDLAALAPLAAQATPTAAALASALPSLAAQASADARAPGKDAGPLSRFLALLGKVVVVRSLDPTRPGPDGLLAKAEGDAAAGDLDGAVRSLSALPADARAPVDGWIAAARRRLEIDRRIAALRARALAALEVSEGPP